MPTENQGSSRSSRDTRKEQDAASRQPTGTPEESRASDESVDFGSYVSSTVRSSSELFGTPSRSSRRSRPAARPRDASDSGNVAPASPVAPDTSDTTQGNASSTAQSRAAGQGNTPTATQRSSTYWREQSRQSRAGELDLERGDDANDGEGQSASPWAFGDGQRPSTAILAAIGVGLLTLVLLIWVLNRDGDNGTEGTPTPTPESVIAPDDDQTGVDPSTPPPFVDEQDPTEPSSTEPPRRGGDNQRDNDEDGTPGASGDDPLAGIELGPIAQQCSDRCLVRLASNDGIDQLVFDAETRPSFEASDWKWVIASPEGIAYLEQHTDTTLVQDSGDTLALYIARVPSEEASDDRLASMGTVIDSAGEWRLIRAASVPANVRSLTDWGYEVSKLSPAPPQDYEIPEESTALSNVEIGSLIDDVSGDNITATINDLTTFGTRYYTTQANMESAEYLFQRLESYGLRVWYEDFLSWEGYLMVNVIGEVPGADESAIYGVMAHFDTISSDISDSPGADDNATGVSASLEIARILGSYELEHPVRVLFVNVEEVGIVGSNQLAARAVTDGVPLAGVFNLDSVGAARQYNYMVVNGSSETTWMVDLYRQINDAYDLGQVINAQTNDKIVADDNKLRENGIDAIMVARELYGQSPYHHTSQDTIDTLRIEGVESCTQLTLLSLAELAKG